MTPRAFANATRGLLRGAIERIAPKARPATRVEIVRLLDGSGFEIRSDNGTQWCSDLPELLGRVAAEFKPPLSED